ncbi:MAG: hypothetical protein Q9162_002074 [Coniocarpon cinnabarinum]
MSHPPSRPVCALLQLPDELVQHILTFLPLPSLVTAERINHRLNALVRSNTVFAVHCVDQFRFWHPKHNLRRRLRAPIAETDWRQLLVERAHTEERVSETFEELLQHQAGRTERSEVITGEGYDSKDFLLQQVRTSHNAEDYLARTWWAETLLAQIERHSALEELFALRHGKNDLKLERALACLDLLIVPRPPENLEQVEEHFDRIAVAFLHSPLGQEEEGSRRTSREKALHLARFLHDHQLLGIQPEPDQRGYRRLQNGLISIALCEKHHPSLPLVSAAIYCAVARRVGLNANLINYPGHIYVVVTPDPDSQTDLDNQSIDQAHKRQPHLEDEYYMYLDSYSSSRETSSATLKERLLRMHFPEEVRRECLRPAVDGVKTMLVRMSNNLAHVTEYMESDYTRVFTNLDDQSGFMPPSVLEAATLTPTAIEIGDRDILTHTRNIIRMVTLDESFDSYSYELTNATTNFLDFRFFSLGTARSVILPLLSPDTDGRRRLEHTLIRYAQLDAQPRTPKRWSDTIHISKDPGRHPVYRVGTYFEHRRFGYLGLIIGWDVKCSSHEEWIRQMHVDDLPRGRHQPFYNVLDTHGGQRYVAEENIVCLGRWQNEHREGDEVAPVVPDPGITRRAGEWMKRWDPMLERFVSNLKDEYPDD